MVNRDSPTHLRPTPKGFSELVRANLAQIDKRGHSSEMWWAGAFAAEGDREQAIAWLRKAVANHDSEFSYNVRDPIFDFLRADPRYLDLMRGVGLPP